MRLLNTRTHRLEYVLSSNIPEYAILSHRWGDINDEAHFSDISDDSIALPETKGFQKLVSSCKQASKDGYKYIWIDTCCIDKSSSAELSEAINSMFKWYRQARICYAYLEDVRKAQDWKETERQIRKSKWFTRGWTLQELIAPPEVLFFDDAWTRLGKRNHKGSQVMLTEVTGVSGSILCRNDLAACTIEDQPQMHSLRDGKCIKCCKPDELPELLNDFSVAQRMSWSATRETTRLEDQAYCLLGLFDVNMPLLYGEGKKAFLRLQEEIIKKSDSQSILAHEALDRSWKHDLGLLAESPSFFSQSDILDPELVEISRDRKRSPLTLNSKSIEVGIYLCPCSIAPGHDTEYWMGILDCSFGNDAVSRPGLILTSTGPEDETFCRLSGSRLVRVGPTTSQGKIPVNTEQGLVTLEYDLREVKFRNVSLLLTSLNQGAIRKQAFFTTPSLRVKAEDNIRCRMGYPVVNTAESESDPIYFPPVRYNSRLLPGNSLCGIISVSAEESKERFFVLWGFNHITRINFPWESSVRTRHGSPWCRIIDWCDIMGYADWSEYMQKGLLDHFYKRAEAIMIAFNDGNDKCCPEELETELMSCAARWAKDEMKSIDTRVSDTGERIQIRIKDVLFLGRVLFELQIS